MNPNNPSPSEANNGKLAQPPPTQPASPSPHNLTGPSESNKVFVGDGISAPPNPSNNLGRKIKGRKSKSAQGTNILPPPLQNTQQPPLLHPMQQSEWAQAQSVPPMQQNQRPQAQLLQPMQHGQWVKTQLTSVVQQNQGPQAQFPQPMEQSQWAQVQPQQQHRPPMMQRISYYSKLVTEVMHYQWERPQNNTIEFWREFVAKYYDSKAKERWCLSMCQDPSIPMRKDGRPCNLCGYRPQRGNEFRFEVLPERFKAKFEKSRGERLNTGIAQVYRPGPGLIILVYTQATHRSIYGFESVIYKGPLRIAITDQRKILSWEFCVCHREAFVSIKQFPFSENWPGIGVLGRSKAKNVSNESSEENLQRNSHTVQEAQPMHQANGQGQQINHNTMNSITMNRITRTSHGGRVNGGQDPDQRAGKPVAVNNIRSTAGSPPVDSMEISLLRNAATNLQTPRTEKRLISDNKTCNSHATHTSKSGHDIISGNGERGLIPNPGMEFQMQEDGEDVERYLIDNPAGQFLTQEMQVINHPPRQRDPIMK